MDTSCLKEHYHSNSYNNAYADIKTVLSKHGFNNIQGSVYLGNEGVSEAHGTIAIQELTARFDWFYSCVLFIIIKIPHRGIFWLSAYSTCD